MRNLEEFGVQELNKKEKLTTEGGTGIEILVAIILALTTMSI